MSKTLHTGKIVTFGELIMRLSPPENRKLQQSNSLNFFFGGTELNVAASLSNFGLDVQFVTTVSDDLVGEAALASVRQYGINTSAIQKNEHPLGLYFLEVGSGMRSSKISYNRLQGSFAHIQPEQFNWEEIFKDCSYFHWTGISPAISENAFQTLLQTLKIAQQKGITITADPAYRSNLWNYGRKGPEALRELIGLSTIFIGGVNEINEILETAFPSNENGFIDASKKLMELCPTIEKVFDKVRTGVSASWQKVYGRAWTGTEYIISKELEIKDVIDRIGTGDAYAAGLIYGLIHFDNQKALNFANAACALKHSILGDANLVNVEDVLEVVHGKVNGKIKR